MTKLATSESKYPLIYFFQMEIVILIHVCRSQMGTICFGILILLYRSNMERCFFMIQAEVRRSISRILTREGTISNENFYERKLNFLNFLIPEPLLFEKKFKFSHFPQFSLLKVPSPLSKIRDSDIKHFGLMPG